jgi:murein DD-endopeptidase MepM/ murein hydrolase activator NlpD
MSSRDRALNYAVRVKGQQEAVAAFRTVGQAATDSISAVAAASQAAGAYDEAVGRASQSAAAFGAAQADASKKVADAKAAFAAGTMGAEAYQSAVQDAKSGLALFKAENQAAARGVDLTARALVAAQQTAANYARQLKTLNETSVAPVAAPKIDARSGMQRLVAGDASVDRAAVSSATLEQVLGRVATKGQAVTAAMQSATAAEEAQAAAADRLRARYSPLYAVVSSYLTTVREIRQAELAGVLSADERAAAITRERQATLGAIAAIKAQTAAANGRSGAQRAAMTNLGYQINDVTTQLSAGTSIAQVFAQQSGQVVGALSMMGKEGGKMAAVMGGPWGLAIVTGISILGLLATKLFETGHGVDELVAKMKKDAEETRKADEARAIFKTTTEGLIEAQRALNKELDQSIKSQRDLTRATLNNAQANLASSQQQRDALALKLPAAQSAVDAARASAGANAGQGTAGAAGAVSQGQLDRALVKLHEMQTELANLDKSIAESTLAVGKAQAGMSRLNVDADLDPSAAAQKKYDVALNHLNIRLTVEPGKTRVVPNLQADGRTFANESITGITADDYKKEYKRIKVQLDADLKAAKELTRTATETTAFAMPVNGRISGQFDEKRPGHLHQGIDIAVPVGTPVKADAGGTIIEAGVLPGYGNVVFIDHGGGTISRLAHLSAMNVKKGDVVGAGDVIGLSGGAKGAPGSGDSTGPHVHYEVRVRGRSVDPRKGPFPTDNLGSADKAAAEQQRLREEAVRHQKEFDDQSAQLDGAILSAKRANLIDMDAIAKSDKDQVAADQAKTELDIRRKVKAGDYDDAEGKQLIEKSKQLAAERTRTIETERVARHIQDAADAELAATNNRMDMLGLEQDLAKTVADRRDIALQMLALEEKLARIKAQETLDAFKIGQATKKQADDAQAELNHLDEMHPLKVESINRQNTGALGKYLQDTDPATINDRVETLVTNELTSVRDGIDEALTNALGVKDPMLKGLLEIFLDEVLFRPIAEALQKSRGGGGGGFGSILGAIGSLFGGSVGGGGGALAGNLGADWGDVGGSIFSPSSASSLLSSLPGFASGTDDLPRGLSWVGENGRELLFNGGGGRISVLNNQQSRHAQPAFAGGGHVSVTNVHINSPQPANPRRIAAVIGRSTQLAAGRAARKGLAAPRSR